MLPAHARAHAARPAVNTASKRHSTVSVTWCIGSIEKLGLAYRLQFDQPSPKEYPMLNSNIERVVQSTFAQLHAIRDQIRQRIYLGATELKEAWLDLEMRAADAEAEAKQARQADTRSLHELILRWEALRSRLCAQ
jgi:hypothetical protein